MGQRSTRNAHRAQGYRTCDAPVFDTSSTSVKDRSCGAARATRKGGLLEKARGLMDRAITIWAPMEQ